MSNDARNASADVVREAFSDMERHLEDRISRLEESNVNKLADTVHDFGKQFQDLREELSRSNSGSGNSTVIIKAAGYGTTLVLLIVFSVFMAGSSVYLSERIDTIASSVHRTQDYMNLIFQKVPKLKKIITQGKKHDRN